MRKSRLTKNQTMYQKEMQRIQRSMRRYAKQGYEFASMDTYFPTPKRITRKAIKELQAYRGKSIRDLGEIPQQLADDKYTNEKIQEQLEEEYSPTYQDVARIQIQNLYEELENFPADVRDFIKEQFEDALYKAGLNMIDEYDLDVDWHNPNEVRAVAYPYFADIISRKQSFVYYIQNSGYGSWEAIQNYCSDVINEMKDMGIIGQFEVNELNDRFEMELGFFESNAIARKEQRKAERQQRREEIKRIRQAGVKYKHGKAYYSPQALAERTKRLKEVDGERIANMSTEEFEKWKKGYR